MTRYILLNIGDVYKAGDEEYIYVLKSSSPNKPAWWRVLSSRFETGVQEGDPLARRSIENALK